MVAKFNAETARAALEGMGGSILFEKVLSSSDANGTGRLVIPKSQAEAHFPFLELQSGMMLHVTDTEGGQHDFRFRFWLNNQSRMYLLENTQDVQVKYRMGPGDVLVFAKLPDGNYGICGRQGTKEDVSSRKAAARRTASTASADGSPSEGGAAGSGGKGGAKRARARGGAAGAETAKSKRMREKQAEQAVQSLFAYWSAYSLPAVRKDGVFRAVPAGAAQQDGDKVVAQFGAWTAIVSVGGELFQAFFDTYDAATAALEAAQQSAGRPAAEAAGTPGSAGGDRAAGWRSASAEPPAGGQQAQVQQAQVQQAQPKEEPQEQAPAAAAPVAT